MSAMRSTVPYGSSFVHGGNNQEIQQVNGNDTKTKNTIMNDNSQSVEKYTKYTKDGVEAKFKEICKSYNIDYDICKDLGNKIYSKTAKDDVIAEDFYNEIIQNFKNTLESCKDNSGKVSQRSIEALVLAESTGLSVVDIINNKKISINDIIKNQLGVNGKNADSNNIEEKKSCLKQYFEKLHKEDPEKAKKELISIVMNSSDEEKMLLMPVLTQVFKDVNILETVFKSFSSKENASRFADSISAEELRELDKISDIQSTIVEHMSEHELWETIRKLDADFEEFYKENEIAIEKILLKRKQGIKNNDELGDDLKEIADKLDDFINKSASITAGILKRDDMSAEKQREAIAEVDKATLIHPDLHNAYLEAVANYINDPKNNMNISIDKVKEILDEVTEGEFSKVLDKVVQEKSATDPETGGFKKTASEAEIKEKREQINTLKEQTVVNSTPQEEPESFVIVNNEKSYISANKTESPLLSTISYSVSEILDIVTGKKSDTTQTEEDNAIESYKLLNTAIQGNLLRNASGKFFNKLLENTKTYTLKLLLATGWKGNSFTETQKVKDAIQERQEKSA